MCGVVCFRACVGLKPQNHMLLEHKHSREVGHSTKMENGHAHIISHLQNGIKTHDYINGEVNENDYINGQTKDLKHAYLNGTGRISQVN